MSGTSALIASRIAALVYGAGTKMILTSIVWCCLMSAILAYTGISSISVPALVGDVPAIMFVPLCFIARV
ncbi:hypothetical protein D3C85_1649990 [compost metagenome]